MWELTSVGSFDSLLKQSSYLCIYWYNERSEVSGHQLQEIEKAVIQYATLRFLMVNISRFPQLLFQYAAKPASLQCYDHGQLVASSDATHSIEQTLLDFYQKTEKMRCNVVLALQTVSSSLHMAEVVVEQEKFGTLSSIAELKKEAEEVLSALKEEAGDENSFTRAINVRIRRENQS